MSVGGVPPTGGGFSLPPPPGSDEFNRELMREASQRLDRAVELLEQGTPANEQEWSFQTAMKSLTGSAQRIVSGPPMSARDAHALAHHVANLAETPDSADARAWVGRARGAVAALFQSRALFDPASEHAMLNAEIQSQYVLLRGPEPASGARTDAIPLTSEVRGLVAQLNAMSKSGSPHADDVALRRVLANLYALAATADHPSRPEALRAAVTALVNKAAQLVEDGSSAALVDSMTRHLVTLRRVVDLDPSLTDETYSTLRSMGWDLRAMRPS